MNSKKGQFSFDLIIAILLFLAATQTIFSMTQSFEESQKQIATQNQLRGISETVSSKISQAALLPNSDSSITFKTPFVMLAGSQPNDCSLKISKTEEALIEVSVKVQLNYAQRPQSIPLTGQALQDFKDYCSSRIATGTSPPGLRLSYDSIDYDFSLGFFDGIQEKVLLIPLKNASSWQGQGLNFNYIGDCYDVPNQRDLDLTVESIKIAYVTKTFNTKLFGRLPGIIFEKAEFNSINCANENTCDPNDQTCPGEWIVSKNKDRCCNAECSDSGEVQADYVSTGAISKRTSISVPLETSNLADNFSFNCGNSIKCSSEISGISCALCTGADCD